MSAPYMPFFIADYLADTAHLSAAQHGAYLLLIMNYWQRGKPLPADDRKLARIARMSDDEWMDARDALSEFFVDVDGEWTHKRIDAELAVAAEKSAKAKASARASVNVRKANAERTLNERSTNAQLLGEDREGKSSEANASGEASPPPALASPKDRIWSHAPRLAVLAGKREGAVRSFLGKCLAEFDADIVERAVLASLDEGSGDPCAYITRCLKPANGQSRASPRSDPNSFENFDPEAMKAARRERMAREAGTIQ